MEGAKSNLESLPLSRDLLKYYQEQLAKNEQDYLDAMDRIDALKVSHGEAHQVQWDLNQKSNQVADLEVALSESQKALVEERRQTLRLLAENDQLKIQELQDRRKIRYLLSISTIPESETTYFRDKLDKRLIRLQKKGNEKRGDVKKDLTGDDILLVDAHDDEEKTEKQRELRNIVILEDEIEALKLTVTSLRAQLDEQKRNGDETVLALLDEQRVRLKEEKARRQYEAERIDQLTKKVDKLRVLCRENTRALLNEKKRAQTLERRLIEEKIKFSDETKSLKIRLEDENKRNESAERVIENRVVRQNQALVAELRSQLGIAEAELDETKRSFSDVDANYKKKTSYLEQRLESVTGQLKDLQRRRHFEMQGFTADIQTLRKQMQGLEKVIVKFGPLEDREALLLKVAKGTNLRASKTSSELQHLKGKIYEMETNLRSLAA